MLLAEGQKSAGVKHFMHLATPSARQEKWRKGSNLSRKTHILSFSAVNWRKGSLPLCQLGDAAGKVVGDLKIMSDIALRFASQFFATLARSWK
jgi:hypothetical protein